MIIRNVAILLFLFIFGITAQAQADSVKSPNHAVHQERLIKIGENKGAIQTKGGSTRAPVKTSKKYEPEFDSRISYRDAWWTIGNDKLNFLKIQKKKMKNPFADSRNTIIYSYAFFQNVWGDKYVSLQEVTGGKIPSSESGHLLLKPFSDENKYDGGEGWMTTYKLLQSKRMEILKEIFIGFYLSFDMKNRHLFFEMDATPNAEKGSRIIIPF